MLMLYTLINAEIQYKLTAQSYVILSIPIKYK